MTSRERVLRALDEVIDPELDEPITTLRFVSSVEIDDGAVEVRLRLPTPQCAPNFAFLMAADASAAVRRLPGSATSAFGLTITTPARRSTTRSRGARGSRARSLVRPSTMTCRRCASCSLARR